MTGQPQATRDAIAAMGTQLGPDVLARVQALYAPAQDALARNQPVTLADIAYGDAPRQQLDVYAPVAPGGAAAPVLIWVHGGGFVRGEKSSPAHPYNAHVGRWAARSGMLGLVMNYRLAPDNVWPSGGEDVGHAVDWARAHAADHGGDPDRIVLMGTSAGAIHIATHLRLRPEAPGVSAAVLLSGLYGFTPLDDRDTLYYGTADAYPDRCPRVAVVATDVPLFVACAQLDPPRFQADTIGLLTARLARHDRLPRTYVAGGHNHFSMATHIGTSDTRLTDEILGFLGDII